MYFSDEQVYGKDGNPQPFGTPEEILEAGQKCTESFQRDKGIFDFMMENELLDVFGRRQRQWADI